MPVPRPPFGSQEVCLTDHRERNTTAGFRLRRTSPGLPPAFVRQGIVSEQGDTGAPIAKSLTLVTSQSVEGERTRQNLWCGKKGGEGERMSFSLEEARRHFWVPKTALPQA